MISIEENERKSAGMKRPVAFFLLCWMVLNMIQVSFMELTSDEGYYWFYSQHLQWGYYDHPPFIALMIKAGSIIFPGELGVRFFNVVLSTAGLYLFFLLLPGETRKTKRTYFVLLAAPLLHYLTFLVFPDGPMLFFSLLFLVAYKRFLQKPNWWSSLLVGFALAFMAYSKYHGALVLLFTLVANPKLLKSVYFYAALMVAGLLFFPHLWWQYQNDFPTLKYHLSGRTGTISFRYVGEFLSQQVVAIGPGLIFIPFVVKTKDVFERTLKVIIIGTFVFFLVSSFKTFVHFHWTSIALYPILYFAVQYYNLPAKKKLLNSLLLPFVVLFAVARVLLAVPLIPTMHVGEDYYHGRKQWAQEIAAVANDRPVFMPNNLREASLYSFYSGQQGVTLYSRPEKKSQYELWGYEDSLQNREVVFVSKYPFSNSKPLANHLNPLLQYDILPSFRSYFHGVAITANISAQTQDSIVADVEIINHRAVPLYFSGGLNGEPAILIFSIERNKKLIHTGVLEPLSFNLLPQKSIKRKISIPVNGLMPYHYLLYFGIRNGVLPDAIVSPAIPIKIKTL